MPCKAKGGCAKKRKAKEKRLYNEDKQELREFKRGDTWREDTAYRCEICYTKTNKWIMGGAPGMGPRLLCPGDSYQEHDELESALKQHNRLDRRIQDFEKDLKEGPNVNQKKAQNMIDSLCSQRELLEARISRLRRLFSGRLDDIEGLNTSAPIEDFYPSSRYIAEKKPKLKDEKRKKQRRKARKRSAKKKKRRY